MSQSFPVECPHCHAKGELDDPKLVGRPLACPACRQVFVVSVAPAAATPVQQPISPAPAAPQAPVVPQVVAPTALPVPTTASSASTGRPGQSRSQKKIPKLLIWSGASAAVLFALVIYMIGESFRVSHKNRKESVAKKETPPRKRPSNAKPTIDAGAKTPEMTVAENTPAKNPETKVDPVDPVKPTQPAESTEPKKVAVDPVKPEKPSTEKPENEKPKPVEPAPPTIANTKYVAPILFDDDNSENGENVPREVRSKLDSLYGPQSVPAMLEFLKHPHAGVRERAVSSLSYQDSSIPGAQEPLLKLLQDRVSRIRSTAANALKKHTSEPAAVIEMLGFVVSKDPVRDVRTAAVGTLRELVAKDPENAAAAAAVLIPAFLAAREEDMSYLAPAVGSLGDAAQPVLPLLVKLLKNDDCSSYAAMALAELGQIEQLKPIIENSENRSYSIKTQISEGFGRQKKMTLPMLELIKTLASDKEEYVRRAAVAALKTCEPKLAEALPLLEAAQSDSSSTVREAAAEAFAAYEINPDQKVRGLLKQMLTAKPDAWERSTISSSIRKMKAVGLKSLIGLFGDEKLPADMRDAAVDALAIEYWDSESKDVESLEKCKEMLKNAELPLGVRVASAIVLANFDIRLPQSEPTLMEAVRSDALGVKLRERSAGMLDRSDGKLVAFFNEQAQKLEQPLPEDAKKEVREAHNRFRQTILSLLAGAANSYDEKNKYPEIIPRYLIAIEKGDHEVKSTALSLLRTVAVESPEAVAAARSMLKHESTDVRRSALSALGKLNKIAKEAIPEIRAALKDEDNYTSYTAADAIGEFGPAAVDAVPDLLELLKADERRSNSAVPMALARIAPKDAAVQTALVGLLDQKKVPDGVLAALEQMKTKIPGVVPPLLKRLPGADRSESQVIFMILAKQEEDAKPAIPAMIRVLSEADSWTQGNAIVAICQLKQHAVEALPEIVKLAGSDDEHVQSSAIRGLQIMGPAAKSVIPDLEKIGAASRSQSVKYNIRETIKRLNADPNDVDGELITALTEARSFDAAVNALPEDPGVAVQALGRICANADESVGQRAWAILATLSKKGATKQELAKLLDGNDVKNAALASVLLHRLPAKADREELVTQLIPWLKIEMSRWTAMQLISQTGEAGAKKFAEAMVSPDFPANCRELVQSVSHRFARRLVTPLRELKKSDRPEVSQIATVSLGTLHPQEPGLLPELVAIMGSPNIELRRQAIHGIARMSEDGIDVSSAMPGLMKLIVTLPDDASEMSYEAVHTVQTIGISADQLPELRKMLRTAIEDSEDSDEAELYYAYGGNAVRLLSRLGPAAAEALPDIKAFLLRVGDRGYAYSIGNIGEPAAVMLSEIVKDTEVPADKRAAFVRDLAGMKDDFALASQTLKDLCADENLKVRTTAAVALGYEGENLEVTLKVLREALKSDEASVSQLAIQYLGQIGEPASPALPEIMKLAESSKDWQQAQIAHVLFKIAPTKPEVQEVIIQSVKSSIPFESSELSEHGESLIPRLTKAVQEENDPIRSQAAEMLGSFEAKASSAVPALQALMASDKGDAGLAATISLARIAPDTPDLMPRLAAAYDNPKSKYKVAEGLIALGPRSVSMLPKLMEEIEGGSEQGYVYKIIGKLGPAAKPAIPLLMQNLSDPLRGYAIAEALGNLDKDAADVVPELIAMWRRGESTDVVFIAFTKMKQTAPTIVNLLVEDLKNEETRLEALDLLASFGASAEPAFPQLLEFAKSDNAELRMEAFQAMCQLESHAAESVPVLASALKDENRRVVIRAAQALARLSKHAGPAMPQILAGLERDLLVRNALLSLVEEMGPAAVDAMPLLEKLSKSDDYFERVSARDAIKSVQGKKRRNRDLKD